MFEKMKRGGLCCAFQNHAKANNKYMENYDQNIPSSFLAYYDANNLYGWAMSQKLPLRDFKLVELENFSEK